MNYSRYIYYKTLVVSTIEWCSEWGGKMTSTWWMRLSLFLRSIVKKPSTEDQQFRLFLESIEDEIRSQVQKVHSKQEGGYWPVTTGDKIFIEYMNNTLAAIEEALRKMPVGQREWRTLINHLEQMLVRSETEHNPKVKAVFLAQEMSVWPSFESVYEAFTDDPACEAQLVYVPFEHKDKDKFRDEIAEYKEAGLPIIHCRDYNLSVESPDLVFFIKPYDCIPMQFYIDNVDRIVSRCVYTPYYANIREYMDRDFHIDYHFRMPLHNKAWKIFDAPYYVRNYYSQYGSRNGDNVVIGHPRFDYIRKLTRIMDSIPLAWKNKIDGRKVFMWNTSRSFGDSYKEADGSTFAFLRENMFSFFNLHKESTLLWRPHPLFFGGLVNTGGMAAKEIEELKITIEKSDNIILDTLPDYRYAMSVADALISDSSSLLLDFLLTDKPIMYMCLESTVSKVNKVVLPAFYKSTTWLEIEEFINMVKEGRDDKRAERMKVTKQVMVNLGNSIGIFVKDTCIKGLFTEEMGSAKKVVEGFVWNEKSDSAQKRRVGQKL